MGYFTLLKRFFLFILLMSSVAGCGSSGSTANTATGSIAVNLTWNPAKALSPAKTLYAAPAGVITVKIFVSAADMTTIVKDFPASVGSGTIDGIPVGTGRTVKVQGLDAGGVIRYQGSASGITVNLGSANDPVPIIMLAPVTTASPAGGSYTLPYTVTLTASEPATIYYTTNGLEPDTNSTQGASPITGIQILTTTILKFFAIDSGFAREQTQTVTYN